MSDESDDPSNLPQADGKIDLRGFFLAIRFHPEIKLGNKRGHQFAASLADYLSLEKDEYESHKWTFLEPLAGEPASQFTITVTPNEIALDMRAPTHGQEWVERRFETVLTKFVEQFQPWAVLHCKVVVRGHFPVDGDARACLGGRVMNLDPDRMGGPFGRPVHLIGLRFFFPPFKKKGDEGEETTEWAVDVKAESLMEDPSKLFLEAKAEWLGDVQQWTDESTSNAVAHLDTVKDYLETNVVGFLKKVTQANDDLKDNEEEDQ